VAHQLSAWTPFSTAQHTGETRDFRVSIEALGKSQSNDEDRATGFASSSLKFVMVDTMYGDTVAYHPSYEVGSKTFRWWRAFA